MEEQFEEKRKEVLAKFNPEFIQKYLLHDATFHHVYNLLLSDTNPYRIIELLIENRKEMMDKLEEFVNRMPSDRMIMTQEQYDDFYYKYKNI
jgi:hypothetical protein